MSKSDPKTTAILRDELNDILQWFESEDFTPEAAVDKFREAEKLAEQIEKRLVESKNAIKVLAQRFDESE